MTTIDARDARTIYVVTGSNRTDVHKFKLFLEANVLDLKRAIEERLGILVGRQKLLQEGKPLLDDATTIFLDKSCPLLLLIK